MAQKAVAAMPEDSAIVDTLAWVYYKQGKLKQALVTQQRAVGLTPDEPGLRYHMGAIEEALGHLPAAREEYSMALRVDPKMPEARLALAKLDAQPPKTAPPR